MAPSRWKRSQSGSSGDRRFGRREEALRRRVGADDQRDVADARRGSARAPPRAPARRSRRRRRSSSPARRSSRAPARTSRPRRSPGSRCASSSPPATNWTSCHATPASASAARAGVHAVLDEVAAPLAPGVHADAEDRDLAAHCVTPARLPLVQMTLLVVARRRRACRARAPSPCRPRGRRRRRPRHLAEHHHPLALELDRRDRVGLERIAVRRRAPAARSSVGVGPEPAARRQLAPPRTPCPRSPGCGRSCLCAGRNTCRSLVQRVPSRCGRRFVEGEPALDGGGSLAVGHCRARLRSEVP